MKTIRQSGIWMSVGIGIVAFVAWTAGKPLDAEFLAEFAILILLLVEYCLPKE